MTGISKKMANHHLAYRLVVRITKRDSAWVYHILEGQEGAVSYSTLLDPPGESRLSPGGESTCLLELTIPAGFLTQVQEVLHHLQQGGVWMEPVESNVPV